MSILNTGTKALAIALLVGLGLLLLSGSEASSDIRAGGRARIIDAWNKLPLSFEANQGQTDQQVKFLSRGPGYALFLTPTEAVLSLNAANEPGTRRAGGHDEHGATEPGGCIAGPLLP